VSPIAHYLERQRLLIGAIRSSVGSRPASHLTRFFECYAKLKLSRTQGRKIKRAINAKALEKSKWRSQPQHQTPARTRAAALYRCALCHNWHVHSVTEPVDLIIELNLWMLERSLSPD
jgi:hypothetical protein